MLIVVGEARLRRALADSIAAAGYAVEAVASAAAGRRRLVALDAPASCIVIYMMGLDDSGVEFLLQHRSDPRTSDVPVVLFSTGRSLPLADPPPFMMVALMEFIARHCRRKEGPDSAPPPPGSERH